MLNIILFGPPGSGKGTQSEKLVEKFELKHLSTGDLLRAEIANKTTLGLAAQGFMNEGKLVPDEVVIGMIDNAIENNKLAKGFLFDGFPRTIAQAKALDELLAKKDTAIHQVLFLQVNEEELIKRLVKRAETSGRADDANVEIQKKRQEVYKNETLPVSDYYSEFGKVKKIAGEGTVEEIFKKLAAALAE